MLPVHFKRPSAPSDRPALLVKSFFGRPLLRWVPVVIGLVVTFYFALPFLTGESFLNDAPSSITHKPIYHGPVNPHHPPPIAGPATVWSDRADQVKAAFVHAYAGYKRHAHTYDELLPVTGRQVNNFNGWGVTVFDALDTMWIMDLKDEFYEALDFVAQTTFELQANSFAPFFETVIRYLGGLLSAYALSREPVLLTRADDLGRMLLPAFDTPSGLPNYAVNTVTGKTRAGWANGVLWAEALSNQMEYKYLAHLTGRPEYYNKTQYIMEKMYEANVTGLFPTMWDKTLGTPLNTHFSVGAFADSAHEYLLKQYLLSGKSDPKTKDLYLRSMTGVINELLYITSDRKLLYVTDLHNDSPTHNLEHLSCFLPGLLALGIHTLELSPRDKELHEWAARGIAQTCWMTYHDQPTGLGPDKVSMSMSSPVLWTDAIEEWETGGQIGPVPGLQDTPREPTPNLQNYSRRKAAYLLRPETVESFYILWRTTGEERWREYGWAVFQSIEKHARTKYGYASIYDVYESEPQPLDEMPSYFLAETLKYLYLLFTDEDILPLDKWVFNTEAHPFPIFEWDAWEKERYHILS
ncbi:glycoside hydrolase [Infundibulicybe gibba]|nr:glycoside hydrolase [Infundibulicybe gibba]